TRFSRDWSSDVCSSDLVIVRFFTVPRVRDARISAGYALLFIAILYTTAPAVGAMARYNLANTILPGEVGEVTANIRYEDRPAWMETWEQTGLITFEDKNGDGRIDRKSTRLNSSHV